MDTPSAVALFRLFDSYLFTPTSLEPLAAFRVLFGAVLFAEAVRILPYCTGIYAEGGILGRPPPRRGAEIDLLSPLVGSPRAIVALFAVHAVACLSLAIGFATSLSALAIYLNFLSRKARGGPIFHGGDAFALFLSLFLVFSPAGALWSVDASLGLVLFGASTPPIALRLMQLLLPFVYFRTFQWKAMQSAWIDGSALYLNSAVIPFVRSPGVPRLLHIHAVSAIGTWIALAAEGLLPFGLLFRETQRYAAAFHAAFHLGILAIFRMKVYQWIMLSMTALYLTGADIRWLFALAHR